MGIEYLLQIGTIPDENLTEEPMQDRVSSDVCWLKLALRRSVHGWAQIGAVQVPTWTRGGPDRGELTVAEVVSRALLAMGTLLMAELKHMNDARRREQSILMIFGKRD